MLALAELVGRALLAAGEWVYQHTLGRVASAYVRRSRRGVAAHLAWVRRPFGRDAYRLFPVGRQVRAALRSWHQVAPLAAVAYLVKAFILLQILLNLGASSMSSPGGRSMCGRRANELLLWWTPGGGLWGPARQVEWTGEQPDIDVTVVTTFRAFR
ncbi:hypothetical protein ACFC09_32985 [Streptomyces sp. NPDC056161]|uniref:hypothetical protein n=1 Tax=Streptomyces sp. NPDC056161 TaxID=3345732 RepID=UPI0035E26D53